MPSVFNIYEYTSVGSLPYYRAQLAETNPVLFYYMSDRQKEEAQSRLLATLALLRVDAQEHMARGRRKKLNDTCNELSDCVSLLNQLAQAPLPAAAGHLRYLGLNAALDLQRMSQASPTTEASAEVCVENFITEATAFVSAIKNLEGAERVGDKDEINALRQDIGNFNDVRRMYWVWGCTMYAAFFEEFARQAIHLPYEQQLKQGMDVFSPTMGTLSGFIYFFRFFAVELREAWNEVFSNSKSIPVENDRIYREYYSIYAPKLEEKTAWQRFMEDFSHRKFILLNDILWASVNTFCFAYGLAKGSGAAFTANALTLVFLVGDVILTLWRYLQFKDEHKIKVDAIGDKIGNNKAKIRELERELRDLHTILTQGEDRQNETLLRQDLEKLKNQISYLKGTNEHLQCSQKELDVKWTYQQYKLWNELGYTVGLVAGWGLTCAFFIGGIAGATIMGVVGSVFLFTLTLAFNAINGLIDYRELKASAKKREEEAHAHLIEFDTLLATVPRTDENVNQLRYHYLQMKALTARSGYDRALARFELKQIPVNALISAMVPAVFFCSLVFLQLGWAILAIATFLALVVAAQRLLKASKPTMPNDDPHFFPRFNRARENEYDREFNDFLTPGAPVELSERPRLETGERAPLLERGVVLN